MKTISRSKLSALFLALLLPLAASAAGQTPKHGKHSDPLAEKLAGIDATAREAAFLGLMIQHHRGGVEMAALVPERAKSEELKKMMSKSAAEQKREIEQMTSWLKQWHKKSPKDYEQPEKAVQMMQKDMAELKGLQGEAFDKLFAEKMAHHHLGAIEMSQMVMDHAQHEEVKTLARKIIETQRQERQQLLEMHERKSAE